MRGFCTECGGRIIVSQGIYVCSSCGLVYGPLLVQEPYVLHEENKASIFTFIGERLHIASTIGSYIDEPNKWTLRDAFGKILTPDKQIIFRRWKIHYDTKIKLKHKETLYRGLKLIEAISSQLNLPSIIRDRAAYLYRKSLNEIREIPVPVRAAVSMYLAIGEAGVSAPITLEELSSIFKKHHYRISKKSIVKYAIKMRTLVKTKFRHKSEDYIPRIINAVFSSSKVRNLLETKGLSPDKYRGKLERKTFLLCRKISERIRGGRNPYTFAASLVYAAELLMAMEEKRKPILSQRLIAKLSSVAEYTLRDHYLQVIKKYIFNRK